MEVEERRSKKKMLVIKLNEYDDLQYYGEYLSLNSGSCGVAGTVAERKNIAITWLFKW